MKLPIVILCVLLIALQISVACPPGQYNPGPDCSFEEICPIPLAHSGREHYCDCWCNAGTVRDTATHECVRREDCTVYQFP
ncbi:unnamed protein product [Chrysodeixis includens]|uniref:TIL domain-containing protein n=1 Tax=Chrysodeixis includens TaxID=689277 RepID=A0A9P0BWL3_CHRIL|nr:unnamed protein product [Chrysodeixis includens]